jgi:hypothetical protein
MLINSITVHINTAVKQGSIVAPTPESKGYRQKNYAPGRGTIPQCNGGRIVTSTTRRTS